MADQGGSAPSGWGAPVEDPGPRPRLDRPNPAIVTGRPRRRFRSPSRSGMISALLVVAVVSGSIAGFLVELALGFAVLAALGLLVVGFLIHYAEDDKP
jgi:hypothetical protein